MKKSLSLLIPAYNEEELIENTIKYYHPYLKKLKNLSSFEIIICVNGSTDNTGKVAKKLSEKYKEVSYFETKRKGLGVAIKLGILRSKKDYITFMPGDGEIKADFIGKSLGMIDKNIFIIGSRKTAGEYTGKSFSRKFLSYGLNVLLTILLSRKAIEATSAQMYPGDWARKVSRRFVEDGFEHHIEIVYYALRDGLDFKNAPAKALHKKDASQSSVKVLNTIWALFKASLKYGIKLKIHKLKSIFR